MLCPQLKGIVYEKSTYSFALVCCMFSLVDCFHVVRLVVYTCLLSKEADSNSFSVSKSLYSFGLKTN